MRNRGGRGVRDSLATADARNGASRRPMSLTNVNQCEWGVPPTSGQRTPGVPQFVAL